MTDEEILVDTLIDDTLADSFESWREEQCDTLYKELEEVFKRHVNGKKDYYLGMPEKFVEHTINMLKTISKCEVIAYENKITVWKELEASNGGDML